MKVSKQNIIGIVIVIILVAAGAFFGGMKYQQAQRGSNFRGNGALNTNQRNGFRPVNGSILSTDSKSITVKMQDGSSKIVLINDKTVINKTSEAVQGDLTVGEKVNVFGTDNSDGSVTAQNIQLNPLMRTVPGDAAPSK
jgi:hypothetical protein